MPVRDRGRNKAETAARHRRQGTLPSGSDAAPLGALLARAGLTAHDLCSGLCPLVGKINRATLGTRAAVGRTQAAVPRFARVTATRWGERSPVAITP